jgi:hypothetical protein
VGNVIEEWPDMAVRLATGRLDLDHVGPEIAEKLAAELALLIGEFQNPQPCQRARIAHWSMSSM